MDLIHLLVTSTIFSATCCGLFSARSNNTFKHSTLKVRLSIEFLTKLRTNAVSSLMLVQVVQVRSLLLMFEMCEAF